MIRNLYILFLLIPTSFTINAQNFFGTHNPRTSIEPENCTKYGLLYNWYAVDIATTGADIAPEGWHVPTSDEFNTLITYTGGGTITNQKLKESGTNYWGHDNGTDDYGFSARGSGVRRESDGGYQDIDGYAGFWSSYLSYGFPDKMRLSDYDNAVTLLSTYHTAGWSVRLVKDNTTLSHGETSTMTGNDGTVYPTICIGTQEWLAVNLMETHFRDGSIIPFHGADNDTAFTNAEWAALSTAGVCAYNNDVSNVGCDFSFPEPSTFENVACNTAFGTSAPVTYVAQNITLPSSGSIIEIAVPLRKIGSPVGNITAYVYEGHTTLNSSVPAGSNPLIDSSNSISMGSLQTVDINNEIFTFSGLPTGADITLVLAFTDVSTWDGGNYINWCRGSTTAISPFIINLPSPSSYGWEGSSSMSATIIYY